MKRITKRALHCARTTIEDRNDPTQPTTIYFDEIRNRRERRIELRHHWDLELMLNGRRIAYGAQVEAKLVRLIGLTVAQLQRAFERAHPTIHRDIDPMGEPWQYE